MEITIAILCLLVAVSLFAAKRYGALKYFLVCCGSLVLNGCLSFSTTERPAPVVTRTETVYVTENGNRVRRVVTLGASGRRYYVDDGRTVYVDHYVY
jgi:hypothetical protein